MLLEGLPTPLLFHYFVPGLILTSTPPTFVQSYQIRIKARARTPSRRGTMFLLVRGIYNPRNLRNFKGWHHCASVLAAAPHSSISHACATLGATRTKTVSHRTGACPGFELPRIIHERFCCNRRSTATTSLRPAGSPLEPSPYRTSTHRVLRAPRAGLARLSDFATNRHE